MKVIASFICIVSMAARSVNAQTTASQSDVLKELVNHLASEVKVLKSQVKQLQLDDQRRKLEPLELELKKVSGERQRFEVREGSLYQDVAQLDRYLVDPSLGDADRAEIEKTKAAMIASDLQSARAEKEKLIHREADLHRRLTREQQIWNELVTSGK